MANGITGIDHVVIGADDLAGAAETWRRLGFTVTPPGRHAGRMTGNACIMFPADYVELIAVVDPGQAASANVALLRERGPGLIGAALATADAEATHAGFAAQGLAPPALADLSRVVALPEGAAEARFRLVALPPARTPALRLFACQQLTPAAVRRPQWLAHANGARGLAGVLVAVAAPEALAADQALIFGRASVVLTDETLTAFAGRQRLIYSRPADLPLLLPEWEPPADLVPPQGIAVALRVADLDRAATCLERNGVGFEEPAAGLLRVPAAEAGGVIVEFTA